MSHPYVFLLSSPETSLFSSQSGYNWQFWITDYCWFSIAITGYPCALAWFRFA